jgi:hypothetical protein
MSSVTFDLYLSPEDETDIRIWQYGDFPDRARLVFGAVSGPAHVGISLSQDQLKELRDKITRFRMNNKKP